jgi:hypothetical protein
MPRRSCVFGESIRRDYAGPRAGRQVTVVHPGTRKRTTGQHDNLSDNFRDWPSSCLRGSRRQARADPRTIRRLGWARVRPTSLSLTRRRPRAAAPAWWRGTWDTRLFACRKRGPRTGDGIAGRCIRRWAWATPYPCPLESICGEFANSAFFGSNGVDGASAVPGAALARWRRRADHCQLSFAAQDLSATGRRATGRGCRWN